MCANSQELPGDAAKRLVQAGYERVAGAYQRARGSSPQELAALADFADRIAPAGTVLDAGCGAGVPAARYLSTERGLRVTGVDFAVAQLALARRSVPRATFLQADITALDPAVFRDGMFDGICCLYAIIHIPREEHAMLLATFRRLLKPGGMLLLSTGDGAADGDIEADWLGAPMYWSHYPRDTNVQLVRDAGFDLLWERAIVEDAAFGGGVHLFILARAPLG
ncbi:MAG: methyltransferase type 11 [Chloroflexi bacterium]|nr:MAG: methyltransferase type 11 [Chloroflexota bacterium]